MQVVAAKLPTLGDVNAEKGSVQTEPTVLR
jgi:hypothetical protein